MGMRGGFCDLAMVMMPFGTFMVVAARRAFGQVRELSYCYYPPNFIYIYLLSTKLFSVSHHYQ
jgi:hypothetical protein